jgi:two-component system chemotaxis response regulator CheB
MANRNVLAVGTSAGGVEALLSLTKQLPADFPAAVLVTIHLSGQSRSSLPELLTNAGAMPAAFAGEGDVARKGRIYVAPPGRHLLIDGDVLSLGTGPRENNVRPAIDPMLRSAAVCCGHRSIGVVLTGTLDDGASGLWALTQYGGATIVQDPQDAAFPEMPLTALNRSKPHHIVKLAEMPTLLERLVRQPAGQPAAVPDSLRFEVEIARSGRSSMQDMDRIGRRSVLACPDCHGVLWEIDEGDLTRFRCHVGHAYTEETMSWALDENLRRALGSALRALEERVGLADKLQRQAVIRGHNRVAAHWAERKQEFEAEANVVRKAVASADEIDAKERVAPSGEPGLS